jgi:prepilin-type N-terminal cleavage/methylation domain-containing protein
MNISTTSFLKKNAIRAGFTLIELMVTISIFVAMTVLLVAKYGSFNDGSLLSSLAYDVALSIRDAQTYGVNVQGYDSQNLFQYPYGIHFSSVPGTNGEIILFADSYSSNTDGSPDHLCTDGATGVCAPNQTTGDSIVTSYAMARSGTVKSLCVGTGPSDCNSADILAVDITFKRPNPNAIITANEDSSQTYAYAEITVTNQGGTATRTIVVRETGEIAVQNQ